LSTSDEALKFQKKRSIKKNFLNIFWHFKLIDSWWGWKKLNLLKGSRSVIPKRSAKLKVLKIFTLTEAVRTYLLNRLDIRLLLSNAPTMTVSIWSSSQYRNRGDEYDTKRPYVMSKFSTVKEWQRYEGCFSSRKDERSKSGQEKVTRTNFLRNKNYKIINHESKFLFLHKLIFLQPSLTPIIPSTLFPLLVFCFPFYLFSYKKKTIC